VFWLSRRLTCYSLPATIVGTFGNDTIFGTLTINFQHDVLKSLAFCDALPTDWDRESCYGGVFMEMIVGFQNLRHGSGDHATIRAS